MNVATSYAQTERFMLAIGAPRVPLSTGELLNNERRYVEAAKSRLVETMHDANMQAWRDLHAEHMANGNYEVAANIMTLKIIPNRS